jgi:hypothetical protein
MTILSMKSYSQTDMTGSWTINFLIGVSEQTEYVLTSYSTDKFRYGNIITLKGDGTFVCAYIAWCGNDCFTTTTGRYEFVDENHIRFILEHISVTGDCEHKEIYIVKDLGLFFVYKDLTEIKFIKQQ